MVKIIYGQECIETSTKERKYSTEGAKRVNVWNSLPTSVDFSTLSAFKRSLERVNLNEFLTVYKFSDVYDCV